MSACPEEELHKLIERAGRHAGNEIEEVIGLIQLYPADARLHFLHGSFLAATRQYESAITAMGRALDLAPGFAVARFQLGFLLFTSGAPANASNVWEPLMDLSPDNALRLFAEGLERLAVDDFSEAAALLRRGIANNTDNPPMNRDMQLLLDEIERMETSGGPAEEPMSATELTLRQAEARKKKPN